ncbi:MAG: hypothetical protein M3R04_09080, partial [bacterium]|nr:hypothetical protein [bacterium]
SSFADTFEKHSGASSIRCEDFPNGEFGSNCRVRQMLTVSPQRHYILSCWVKTDALSPAGSMNFLVYNPSFTDALTHNAFPVASTQGWTQYHIAFNSQDYTEVTMQVGLWGGVSGRFWVDDVELIDAGLVNLIRRPGAPFSVQNLDGSVVYSEGADYDYAVDPLAGQNPWLGAFDIYHARPPLTIPPGSQIGDGDTVYVSGYHAVSTDEGKTSCCLSEDAVYDIIEANFAKLKELIDPQTICVAIDEHRVTNWCASCQATGLTSGGLLNYATSRIDGIAQAELPGCNIVVWSDMYDPDHNAVADYYLSSDSMENTFAGNPPASWDIANWRHFNYNGNTPDTTIDFFAGRGNRQILSGYYDSGGSADIAPWLDYTIGRSGVYACMYTTWVGDYDELENWGQAVKDWDAAH